MARFTLAVVKYLFNGMVDFASSLYTTAPTRSPRDVTGPTRSITL